jgi:hypothetical protein
MSTSLDFSCSPSEIQLGVSTKCTASIANPDPAFTPTGQVSFASIPPGSFTPTACTLSVNNGLASCSANFSATYTDIQRYYTITATYSGDSYHYGSSSNFTISVAPAGVVTVACYPNTITINATTYCVAAVSNTEDFPLPTGTVVFSSNGSGTFAQNTCNLSSSGNCSVFYTPESQGITIITATYGGDSSHATNLGTVQLTVT